ncbi:Salicylate carboxymethyltransferase, partial [Bienertia sinuspersici]
MTVAVKQIVHMKEGTDGTSYANASYLQKQVLSLTKPLKEKALRELYEKEQPTTICIADLGCSSSELNSLSLICELINTIEKHRRELGNGPQEYQVYLNDLPGNDFNNIFRSLGSFEDMIQQQMRDDFGHCFVNGVPGNFYGRLFPSKHLHFVPAGIEGNMRNIYIAKTSPPNVLKAYYNQYGKDFSTFLRCRSKEVVARGMMVLTMIGRRSKELYSKESCNLWDFLAAAFSDMVNEGLIEEEKVNTFNLPLYFPSAAELGFWVEKEGSFTLKKVHVSEVNWKTTMQFKDCTKTFDHNDFAKLIRAVTEHIIVNHFGEHVIEELFHKYTENVKASMAKEKNVFTNVTMVLARKDESTTV